MKAMVKKEFEGHRHPVHGLLFRGVVYEVEEFGELFEPVRAEKKAPKAPANAGEKED